MMLQTQSFSSVTQVKLILAADRLGDPLEKLPVAGLQILSGVGAGKEMDLDRTLTTLASLAYRWR